VHINEKGFFREIFYNSKNGAGIAFRKSFNKGSAFQLKDHFLLKTIGLIDPIFYNFSKGHAAPEAGFCSIKLRQNACFGFMSVHALQFINIA
jgi:hypothetical protein